VSKKYSFAVVGSVIDEVEPIAGEQAAETADGLKSEAISKMVFMSRRRPFEYVFLKWPVNYELRITND
jgi:hypothetical protein